MVLMLMVYRVSWMTSFKVWFYTPMVATLFLLFLKRRKRGPFLDALEFLLGLSLVFAVVFELVALA